MTCALPTLVFRWPWDQTRYPALCRLSLFHQDVGHGQTLWVIGADERPEAEALLCQRLEIEGEPEGLLPEVNVPAWKGKNSLEVVEAPAGWVVLEHQRSKEGDLKHTPYPMPLTLIQKVWDDVWMRYPLDEVIPFERIVTDTCRLFELRRYYRKVQGCPRCSNAHYVCDAHWADGTATCDTNKIQGGKNRRKDYMPLIYHPKKVLEHLGCIHDSSHSSRRLTDTLPLQTIFT